jgi:hypothetical protein
LAQLFLVQNIAITFFGTAKAVSMVAVALMTVVLEEMQGAYERITITTHLWGSVLAGDAFPIPK